MKYEDAFTCDPKWLWTLHHPTSWPVWLRRVMFVTLPVSGPLWMLVFVVVTLAFWLSIIPIAIFNTAKGELWDQ